MDCPECGHPAEHHDGDWDSAGCLSDNHGGMFGKEGCSCGLSESRVYEAAKRCASCGHQECRHGWKGCKDCAGCGGFAKSDATTCTDCPHADTLHYLSTYGEPIKRARRKIRRRCLAKGCGCELFQGAPMPPSTLCAPGSTTLA